MRRLTTWLFFTASLMSGLASGQEAEAPGDTLGEVEAEVLSLKKEDVAWRRIDWKTCLLEGLAASQNEKKPLILWVFIDRPIDDERC